MQQYDPNPYGRDREQPVPEPQEPEMVVLEPEEPAPPAPDRPKGGSKGAVALAVTALCVAAGVLLWTSLYFGGKREPDPPPVDVTPVSTEAPTMVRRYLRSWEGKLALFTGDNPAPDEVYDVYIQSLPPEEQERLNAGIAVDTEEELAGWLEDYTS